MGNRNVKRLTPRLHAFADLKRYDEARKTNIDIWTTTIWTALERLQSAAITDELEKLLHEEHFRALADRCIWAVTEISSTRRWKYLSQRYVSDKARERLELSLPEFGELRHEHVFPRRELIEKLRKAVDKNSVADTLKNGAVSCVVTREEDDRLRAVKDCIGWQRYKEAKIIVVDRLRNKEW